MAFSSASNSDAAANERSDENVTAQDEKIQKKSSSSADDRKFNGGKQSELPVSDEKESVNENNCATINATRCALSAVVALFANELRLQQEKSQVPQIFYQSTTENEIMVSLLAKFLSRRMTPSLFFGTRPILNSLLGYAKAAPRHDSAISTRLREILTMPSDGAMVALDWEVPNCISNIADVKANRNLKILVRGPLQVPVVILLHGINNDANFGYIRCMMDCCARRGWIAVGMNMRGCGGMHLSTPRGYNGAYTGDLRSVVQQLSHRMASGVPIFLAGYSLGANLVVKYLGEEGLSNTLPSNVKGALSLGNPLRINSRNVRFPWSIILGAGIKRGILLKHYKSLKQMRCPEFQSGLRNALLAPTLGELDHQVSRNLIRNEIHYPYSPSIGFDGGTEYWENASSSSYIQHVSIPLLVVSSKDDFLIKNSAQEKTPHCVSMNPNVLLVESETGGHLGWSAVVDDHGNNPFGGNPFGGHASWCDLLSCKFIESMLQIQKHQEKINYVKTGSLQITNEVKDKVKVPIVDNLGLYNVRSKL